LDMPLPDDLEPAAEEAWLDAGAAAWLDADVAEPAGADSSEAAAAAAAAAADAGEAPALQGGDEAAPAWQSPDAAVLLPAVRDWQMSQTHAARLLRWLLLLRLAESQGGEVRACAARALRPVRTCAD
ncbi:MAG: hypothetical protein ACK4YT_13665, partial [Sphingomonas sp.]